MIRYSPVVLALLLSAGPAALAQNYEAGVSGGIGIPTNLTVKNAAGSATAGFKIGPAFGAYLGQNLYERIGGEFHYLFRFADMKLKSSGTEVTFGAQQHAVHYDLLFYGAGRDAPVRPFILAGGGVNVYRGTGKEAAYQALNTFAILSKTQQVTGLITFGAGVKAKMGQRSHLRLEVRDYLTPAPKDVIAPVPGAKLSGWVHNFTPTVGLSFSF